LRSIACRSAAALLEDADGGDVRHRLSQLGVVGVDTARPLLRTVVATETDGGRPENS
jgi:hypothetical protein